MYKYLFLGLPTNDSGFEYCATARWLDSRTDNILDISSITEEKKTNNKYLHFIDSPNLHEGMQIH